MCVHNQILRRVGFVDVGPLLDKQMSAVCLFLCF